VDNARSMVVEGDVTRSTRRREVEADDNNIDRCIYRYICVRVWRDVLHYGERPFGSCRRF